MLRSSSFVVSVFVCLLVFVSPLLIGAATTVGVSFPVPTVSSQRCTGFNASDSSCKQPPAVSDSPSHAPIPPAASASAASSSLLPMDFFSWANCFLIFSVLGGLSHFIHWAFDVDLLSHYQNWRDRNYYEVTINSMSQATLYNQILHKLASEKSVINQLTRVRVGRDGEWAEDYGGWGDQSGAAGLVGAFKELEKENSQETGCSIGKSVLSFGLGLGSFSFYLPGESSAERIKVWIHHSSSQQHQSFYRERFDLYLKVQRKHQSALHAFLRSCNERYLATITSKLLIFSYRTDWPSGFHCTLKDKRAASGVILSQAAESVIEEARAFFEPRTRQYYQSLQIPYRRGFLLYSQPGMGKSSFVQCLATELNRPIYFIHLNDTRMDDALFQQMFMIIPKGSIILLEDIDCLMNSKAREKDSDAEGKGSDDAEEPEEKGGDSGGSRVTLSALLNCLDGVTAYEGSIVIMTSNHPEKLDSALIRSGRIDRKVQFQPPQVREALMLLKKLMKFPSSTLDDELLAALFNCSNYGRSEFDHDLKEIKALIEQLNPLVQTAAKEPQPAMANTDSNPAELAAAIEAEKPLLQLTTALQHLQDTSSTPSFLTVSALVRAFRAMFYQKQFLNRLDKAFICFADIQASLLSAHDPLRCRCVDRHATDLMDCSLNSLLPCLIRFVSGFYTFECEQEQFELMKRDKEKKKKDKKLKEKQEKQEKEKKQKEKKDKNGKSKKGENQPEKVQEKKENNDKSESDSDSDSDSEADQD